MFFVCGDGSLSRAALQATTCRRHRGIPRQLTLLAGLSEPCRSWHGKYRGYPEFCPLRPGSDQWPSCECRHRRARLKSAASWGLVSSSKGIAPTRFMVVFDGYGTYGFTAVAGLSRPDVAKVVANTQAASSGFDVTMVASRLPADTYRVEFLMDADGRQELCDSQKFVNVLPSATL